MSDIELSAEGKEAISKIFELLHKGELGAAKADGLDQSDQQLRMHCFSQAFQRAVGPHGNGKIPAMNELIMEADMLYEYVSKRGLPQGGDKSGEKTGDQGANVIRLGATPVQTGE